MPGFCVKVAVLNALAEPVHAKSAAWVLTTTSCLAVCTVVLSTLLTVPQSSPGAGLSVTVSVALLI